MPVWSPTYLTNMQILSSKLKIKQHKGKIGNSWGGVPGSQALKGTLSQKIFFWHSKVIIKNIFAKHGLVL